jgi:transcription antitermination factor NusG
MSAEWYAIQSKPHKEEALCGQLLAGGFEVFYPKIHANPVNPRARKIKAYFPGYLFVKADLQMTGLSVLQFTPFARGLVTFDKEPATVPEALIAAVRKKVEEIDLKGGEALAALVPGQLVMINDGPFAGYSGIFDVRLSGTERVKVLIQLLSKRYLPVELKAGAGTGVENGPARLPRKYIFVH